MSLFPSREEEQYAEGYAAASAQGDQVIGEYSRRLAIALEALRMYADPESYYAVSVFGDRPCGVFAEDHGTTDVGRSFGAAARRALEAISSEAEKIHTTEKLQEKTMSSVDHPNHYMKGKIEVAVAMDVLGEPSQWLGHALKYACRAPHKGHLFEDLRKAIWCARRAVSIGCSGWYNAQTGGAAASLVRALNDGLEGFVPVQSFVVALVMFESDVAVMMAADALEKWMVETEHIEVP